MNERRRIDQAGRGHVMPIVAHGANGIIDLVVHGITGAAERRSGEVIVVVGSWRCGRRDHRRAGRNGRRRLLLGRRSGRERNGDRRHGGKSGGGRIQQLLVLLHLQLILLQLPNRDARDESLRLRIRSVERGPPPRDDARQLEEADHPVRLAMLALLALSRSGEPVGQEFDGAIAAGHVAQA